MKGGWTMDSCMYDYLEQCFRDCPDCPKADKPEPDWDFIRDLQRESEEDYYG